MEIQKQLKSHGAWIGKWTFILAATGSAVGLGNIWGFPYKAGTNGGGAFVLIYLGCILIIGLPIMISEIIIGRKAGNSPINAMKNVALESKKSRHVASCGLEWHICWNSDSIFLQCYCWNMFELHFYFSNFKRSY
jgi:NSS family neurotransmitter:Na+ symporter